MFEEPREFYDKEIAPYKASLEQWFMSKRSTKLYWQIIFLTTIQVLAPGKIQVFSFFQDLPKPPEALSKYLVDGVSHSQNWQS